MVWYNLVYLNHHNFSRRMFYELTAVHHWDISRPGPLYLTIHRCLPQFPQSHPSCREVLLPLASNFDHVLRRYQLVPQEIETYVIFSQTWDLMTRLRRSRFVLFMEYQPMHMYANYEWFSLDDMWTIVNCFFTELLKKIVPPCNLNLFLRTAVDGKNPTIHHLGYARQRCLKSQSVRSSFESVTSPAEWRVWEFFLLESYG